MRNDEGPDVAGRQLMIHAVVRNRRTDRALDALRIRGDGPECRLVEKGELAAAVSDRGADESEQERFTVHGRVVAELLRRSSLVPLPCGLMARDEDAVRAFLADERLPLLEALDFLEESYEVRLHMAAPVAAERRDRLVAAAHHVYEELRRAARAARILGELEGDRLLSAAFLIPRSEWIRFVELVADWEARYPALQMDVTGPWAPFDFVHLMTPAASRDDGERAAARSAES